MRAAVSSAGGFSTVFFTQAGQKDRDIPLKNIFYYCVFWGIWVSLGLEIKRD